MSSPKRKRPYQQAEKCSSHYHKEWETKYTFVKQSGKGDTYFTCTICKKDLSCSHGGVNDVTKHQATKCHSEFESQLKRTAKLTGFFPTTKNDIADKVRGT